MSRQNPTDEELLEFAERCQAMGRYFLTEGTYQLLETMTKSELIELWTVTQGGDTVLLREKSMDPRHLLL